MKSRTNSLLLFILIFVINSCNTAKKEYPKGPSVPSEYFILQRSWPDNVFSENAYKAGLTQASFISSERTGLAGNWTLQGPTNIGGRINFIAIHPQNPDTILVANAAGGIFRTLNGGGSWSPVFDQFPYLSISCIEFNPINPNIIFAGTGDRNVPRSIGIGDGIYKSMNGGNSWVKSGLDSCGVISKIVFDHQNTNTIYVATMGKPMERNIHRGLYKSIDEGNTWTKILYINNETGVSDVVMNPANNQELFASSWTRIRTNFENKMHSNESRIYKSIDGGANWQMLTNDLPNEPLNRISFAISSSKIYALIVDSTKNLKGIYRSLNGGSNWNIMTTEIDPDLYGGGGYYFGWYFGQITLNPANDNELYVGGVELYKSINGGVDWVQASPDWWTYEVHADMHDLKFVNSSTFYLATDGGLYKSNDNSLTYTDVENIPNTQFYRVAINPHDPNSYYGGAQDNGSTGGNELIINQWTRMFGGDGFQMRFHPTNLNIVYYETQWGGLYYTDEFTYEDISIPESPDDRVNWDMPWLMDVNQPSTLYAATNYVYKMEQAPYGTWGRISDDLTDGDVFGKDFHNISSLNQSPLNAGTLLAGTSDANVWVTQNDGNNWTNITNGLPQRYVTSVHFSKINSTTIYVTHSGYKDNENIAHIHKSNNLGNTWSNISGDLPQLAVNDLLTMPGNDSVLFAATDGGVFMTKNSGQNWILLNNNIPVVTISDIEYNSVTRQLVAGTFARGIYSYPMDSLISNNSSPVNVKEDKRDLFSVFPNPASEFINIESPANSVLTVYNSNGKKMKVLSSDVNLLDVSEWSRGIYFVEMILNSEKKVQKIILK